MNNKQQESRELNKGKQQVEPGLFIIAFILAISVRLLNLGSLPLSDNEALEALKALALLDGSALNSNQPLYTLLTASLFSFFGSSIILARLVPVLAGSMLVLLPLMIRDKLGGTPALILAFALAIDPALVTLSRQAGSVMPAVFLTLASIFFLWNKRNVLAGFLAGMAVLSGSAFWFGVVGLSLIVLINNLGFSRKTVDMDSSPEVMPATWKSLPGRWKRKTWLAFLATILLGGSLFMLVPSGISATVSGLMDYLKGWYTFNGISIQRLLIALVIYQIIPLLLGLPEGISGWIHKDPNQRYVLIAFLVFLVLAIIYNGRQMGTAAWSIICLWVLASWLLSRFSIASRETVLPTLGHTVLIIALMIFIILNVTWVLGGFGGLDIGRSLAILGGLVVIVIISFLVAYGWGIDVASRGVFFGMGLIALAFMLSLCVTAGGLNARSYPDLWQSNSRVIGANMLAKDLTTFSQWKSIGNDSLSIVTINVNSPSLRWLLNPYSNTEFVEVLAQGKTPDVIITDSVYRPELSSEYRGETFAWYMTADWDSLDTFGFADWVLHRNTYETPTNLIIWVRQDLFVTGNQSIIQ